MAEVIPYEEMRRICGLPDMTDFVKEREAKAQQEKIDRAVNKVKTIEIDIKSDIKRFAEEIRNQVMNLRKDAG